MALMNEQTMLEADHRVVHALTQAMADWGKWKVDRSLINQHPIDEAVWMPLAEAIDKWPPFERINGKAVFSGGGGFVLHASSLVMPLLYRTSWPPNQKDAADDAVRWLSRVLTTQVADGRLVAAVWGMAVSKRIKVGEGVHIVPWSEIPDTRVAHRIRERSETPGLNAAWISTRWFGAPGAAIVISVKDVPFAGRFGEALTYLAATEEELSDHLSLLQAGIAAQPLVAASWFEYLDQDIDINISETMLNWKHSEFPPQIKQNSELDASIIKKSFNRFYKLSKEYRIELFRSMDRYSLSLCRNKLIDQVLDLAIALEIATSGSSEHTPLAWKVAVRSAQAIGGPLENRKRVRKTLHDLYSLRNTGSHGGTLKPKEHLKNLDTLFGSRQIYSELLDGLIALGAKPDWNALELEPRTRK